MDFSNVMKTSSPHIYEQIWRNKITFYQFTPLHVFLFTLIYVLVINNISI